MCVSHVHSVTTAEENLLDNRSRTLESQTPKFVPATKTSDAAVFALIDVPLLKDIGAGKNATEALSEVTALLSNERAKFRMLPSDGS